MPSLSHTLLRLSVENMRRAVSTEAQNIQSLRQLLDLSSSALYLPRGVQAEAFEIGDFKAEWLTPKEADPERVILFLHGGGYAVGSITTHRALAGKLAKMAGCRALIIDYRLAPEHPFPAALEDAVKAYRYLLSESFSPTHIVLAGDSAGGGLCMSLQLCLKELKMPLPAGAVLFSPWVDLSFSGQSVQEHQKTDPVVIAQHVKEWATGYAQAFPLNHPMISPLYGDLSGLSPVLIQASDAEVLTDDAMRLARALAAAHTPSHLQLYPGLLHVWQLFWRYVPEANEALEHAATFLRKQIDHAIERDNHDAEEPRPRQAQEIPLMKPGTSGFRVAV